MVKGFYIEQRTHPNGLVLRVISENEDLHPASPDGLIVLAHAMLAHAMAGHQKECPVRQAGGDTCGTEEQLVKAMEAIRPLMPGKPDMQIIQKL